MAIEDTFIPSWFSVSILAGTQISDVDGFIDHNNPQNYPDFPTDLTLSEKKEQARMRYELIVQNLSLQHVPARLINVVAVGADQDTPATEFKFEIEYDRPEFLQTEDELNPGTFLDGADAITRFIARALVIEWTVNREIYDPTLISGIVKGPVIKEITATAASVDIASAESAITVTSIVS